MKRFHVLLALGLLLLGWASCTTVKRFSVDSMATKKSASTSASPGERIVGYTAADAVYHPFKGYIRFVGPDSIRFSNPPVGHALQRNVAEEDVGPEFTLARADVASFSVRRVKAGATFGVAVAVVVVVVAVVASFTAANDPPPPPSTSCPFVYSWDGTQYVLDAEPYGGATVQALERTDVTELEPLVDSNGRYRLLLTNEMRETQHTNRIDLLVVDHAAGLVVATDLNGDPHAFRHVDRLIEANDQAGRDLLPWLREKDQATWHPDLEAASRDLPLADTRDHITLTFVKPSGAKRACLLADAATAPWGAEMIRTMLEMRGVTLGLFYAAINSLQGARDQLHAWNEREELFYLGVEVEEDGRWVKQGRLIGGGPIAAETRAIPLDLSRVSGDRVRVRIHPPVGYWMFNAFRLAYDEEPVRTNVIAPAIARGSAGNDLLPRVRKDDGAYLDFASNDDWAELEFAAPEREPGAQRTIFSRTRGWYEIRLDALGAPDLAAVDRLTNVPGDPVQRAMQDYRRFREAQRVGPAGERRLSMRTAEQN